VSGKVFLLTIELQRVLESSALATGLAFGVLGAGVFAGGILAARIIDKISARTTLVRGLALQGRPTISRLLPWHDGLHGLRSCPHRCGVWRRRTRCGHVAYMIAVTARLPDSK
jgi:hypothetical protein